MPGEFLSTFHRDPAELRQHDLYSEDRKRGLCRWNESLVATVEAAALTPAPHICESSSVVPKVPPHPVFPNPDTNSYLVLSEKFYALLTNHPVPVDLRDIQVLKGSALALDIYCWLVYRLSYLKHPTTIPWELLQMQFGGEYADTKQGRYEFKRTFQTQLQAG